MYNQSELIKIKAILDEFDELAFWALKTFVNLKIASTSIAQRKLKIDKQRAEQILNKLCELKLIGEPNGAKARMVFVEENIFEQTFKE